MIEYNSVTRVKSDNRLPLPSDTQVFLPFFFFLLLFFILLFFLFAHFLFQATGFWITQ